MILRGIPYFYIQQHGENIPAALIPDKVRILNSLLLTVLKRLRNLSFYIQNPLNICRNDFLRRKIYRTVAF